MNESIEEILKKAGIYSDELCGALEKIERLSTRSYNEVLHNVLNSFIDNSMNKLADVCSCDENRAIERNESFRLFVKKRIGKRSRNRNKSRRKR
ncbi:MAG: hypothetical protein J6A19_05025 [Oscillospiraceae bacterium]|nr:hypothetical protein [Oscillospiraceae bacterium]